MAKVDNTRRNSERLSGQLRALRVEAKLSGYTLAGRAGISQPKLSKIETGRLMPTVDDVKRLTAICGADPGLAAELVNLARSLHEDKDRRRIVVHRGAQRIRTRIADARANAALTRIVSTHLVPRWLQTQQYMLALDDPFDATDRRGVLEEWNRFQQLMDRADKSFEILLCEAALRTTIGSPELMAEQAEHIAAVSNRGNIDIRLVPASVVIPKPPETFEVYDDQMVTLTILLGAASITARPDVVEYINLFAILRHCASSPDQSRTLLRRITRDHHRRTRAPD